MLRLKWLKGRAPRTHSALLVFMAASSITSAMCVFRSRNSADSRSRPIFRHAVCRPCMPMPMDRRLSWPRAHWGVGCSVLSIMILTISTHACTASRSMPKSNVRRETHRARFTLPRLQTPLERLQDGWTISVQRLEPAMAAPCVS
uniref:Uncharacterized protein n=1 Tax=Human herpesvirus 2 TaxID=10310 RepID=A0A481TYM3_HHV2|nr:hypothetical protein [Human alphaherpesvirus 2]